MACLNPVLQNAPFNGRVLFHVMQAGPWYGLQRGHGSENALFSSPPPMPAVPQTPYEHEGTPTPPRHQKPSSHSAEDALQEVFAQDMDADRTNECQELVRCPRRMG